MDQVGRAYGWLAAGFCAERASAKQKADLRRSLHEVKLAYSGGDLVSQLAAKDDFYAALLLGTCNQVFSDMLKTIHARAQMLRGVSLQAPGRISRSLDELEKLVDAIDCSDATLARKLAAEHVINARAAALDSGGFTLSVDQPAVAATSRGRLVASPQPSLASPLTTAAHL